MLKNRVSTARDYLARSDADFILFLNMCNIRYLTGFSGSDAAFLLGRERGWFLTDSRYTTQAKAEVVGVEIVEYRSKLEGVTSLLKESGARRVGFEAEQTTVAFHRALSEGVPEVSLLPVGAELENLRQLKDAHELEQLAKTAEIASTALSSVLGQISPGMTERELALELEFAMRRGGADGKAFDFIVASGARGALPHGKASDKLIAAGELVTIDFGAVRDGYHSDETVTIAVGEPDSRQREIYRIVKEAHDLALDAVRPGKTLKELDGLARNFIDAHGYGMYFGHGLGHGVGLEIHEKPVVSPRSDGVVTEGMVFTIEPGIYIPGWGGVRIEDTVYVTGDGCQLLTKVPKGLLVI